MKPYRSDLPHVAFVGPGGVLYRPVPGYEGHFAASCCGKIMGRMRRILRGRKHPKGYRWLNVVRDGVYSNLYVHRAVALTWLPNPQGLPYVNHLDGVKDNNGASNLEWVTAAENTEHAIASGLQTNLPAKGQQGFQHVRSSV